MAQCHAEEKKHPNGAIEPYGGAFNRNLYSCNGGHGPVDPFHNWSKYNAAGFNSLSGNDDGPRKEAISDRFVVSCSSFREENLRSGNPIKADTSHCGMDTITKNGNSSPGADLGGYKGANHIGSLYVGAGKAGGGSPNVADVKNGVSGGGLAIGSSPICNGGTHRRENSDMGAGKTGSSSSGELTRSATKPAIETSSKVCTNLKAGEGSNGGSNGVINSRGSLSCGNLKVGGGHGDNASSGGSSNGGSPTAESFKGGRTSTMGNILGNGGGSPNGGSTRGIGNVGNILGGGSNPNGMNASAGNILGAGSNPNGMVTGSLRSASNKASTNGLQPTPTTHRGTNTSKSSGEIASNGNGSLRGAVATKISVDGNMTAGIITGSNPVRVAKSSSGSPVRSSPSISNVGNLCRGNVLNGKASNSLVNKANGKLDGHSGIAFGVGNLSNGLPSKGGGNVESYKTGADGNIQLAGENNLRRTLGNTDAEEVKNAGNEQYKQGHFTEALSLYDRAITLSPGQASYRSNRAAALIGLGRLAEAVQECEEAIKLDPHYARAHQRAASLYLRLGLVESAKRHLAAVGQYTDAGDMQRIQNVEKHISRCIEARKGGDWNAVIRETDAAIVTGADSAPQIYGYKAEALLKLQRPDDADSVLTAAQRVESSLTKPGVVPADSSLFVIRAQIDMALGRFEGAVAAADSAARIDPRNAEATALLRKARAIGHARTAGNEAFKAGRFFEACASYGEGLESDPKNPVLLCNRAACRSKLGQWEKAVEDCNAALSLQPNYTKALLRRADCNTKLERWEDALRDYEALQREVPGDMELARGLFDVQVAIKKSRGEEIYKMKFGGEVEEVSSSDQFREAVTSPGLAVVQFNTRWSDRCKQLSPFIDQLCKRYPSVNFVKVDVDDHPDLTRTESVSFVPTFKIYKNGLKLKEIIGPSQQALEYAVKHYSL